MTSSPFTEIGTGMICNSLIGSSIKNLQLHFCRFDDECLQTIIADLLLNSELLFLDLSHSRNITDADVQSIFTALMNKDCSVRKLSLRGCNITDDSLQIITDSLLKTKLSFLDIGINDMLTEEGVRKLSAVLIQKECPIKQLYILDNEITDECKMHFIELIEKHRPHIELLVFRPVFPFFNTAHNGF